MNRGIRLARGAGGGGARGTWKARGTVGKGGIRFARGTG